MRVHFRANAGKFVLAISSRNGVCRSLSDRIGSVLQAIHATGALDYARKRAYGYARSARDALSVLPPSDERDALALLADYAIDRSR
jgi:octaprenyl-diphosphate synthase